jgi:hypothetical protein
MSGKKGMRWARPLSSPVNLDELRRSIDAKNVVKMLMEHISGSREMEASQITAAIALLRKVMPDLQATELSGELTHQHVAADTDAILRRLVPEHFERGTDSEAAPPTVQ